ncbi:MAG: FHIPEP family type III secretion protein [Lachnospiraceae bacterium]|nr:FHIPEP family type III secretion protein [Lachnospiraceae bacterium]
MNEKQFGTRISQCRQNKNMTQEELARRLGVTPQALSKWECGRSLPDLSMLAEVCNVLEVSADYLIGRQAEQKAAEENRGWEEIWKNLRGGLVPIEIVFGEELVQVFLNAPYVEQIEMLRERLSTEGILLPVVRLRDQLQLRPKEFMILAYQNVLYSEELKDVGETTLSHMISCLGDAVRRRYAELLHPDLVKSLVDNLGIWCPALIQGVVPEKISYSLLTEVLRGFLERGNSMIYLERVIEYLESALRQKPDAVVTELVEAVAKRLEREDNFWVVLGKRK